jgi:hypothetical protein
LGYSLPFFLYIQNIAYTILYCNVKKIPGMGNIMVESKEAVSENTDGCNAFFTISNEFVLFFQADPLKSSV